MNMPTPDEVKRRFDTQDETLKKILEGMAEHKKYHEMTDPGISEVIDILKGAKGAKTVLSWLAAIAVGGAALWAWLGDHFRMIK